MVTSSEELVSVLEQLREGNDTLQLKREGIVKANLLDYGVSVACNIKDELVEDFKNNLYFK